MVANVQTLAETKFKLLDYKKSRLQNLGLEFIPHPDVQDFGGMDRLKQAIELVAVDYSEAARKQNIPFPKGWLLAGPPGTGKTFAAKVGATKLGFPLISVGVELVKSRGAGYLKRLLQRIEAASPALCYFDEFDKFFDANTAITGGTSQETLGVLLTWLQEKQTKTFVIATLNRLDALPPELTRAGRFDKIWYVGFPQAVERKEIFQLHAARFDSRYRYDDGPLSLQQWRQILNETNYCTGAEIRTIVEMAAKQRFYEEGTINLQLEHLIAARRLITPLYVRDTERVLAMENRARGVAEPASSPDTSAFAPVSLNLWGEFL
jgi:SpoVK/Ycf46/Vps4 family AAA+-type ATPase